jgi:hypothetical protein
VVAGQSKSVAVREPKPHPNFVVDPQDEPSAEWGWHGTWPRATRIAGWFSAFAMFIMLIGNHRGNVENIWLILTGIAIITFLVYDVLRSRNTWRR